MLKTASRRLQAIKSTGLRRAKLNTTLYTFFAPSYSGLPRAKIVAKYLAATLPGDPKKISMDLLYDLESDDTANRNSQGSAKENEKKLLDGDKAQLRSLSKLPEETEREWRIID